MIKVSDFICTGRSHKTHRLSLRNKDLGSLLLLFEQAGDCTDKNDKEKQGDYDC